MLPESKLFVLYLTVINLKALRADEIEGRAESLETVEDLFKYNEFFVLIKDNYTAYSGTLISSNIIVSVPQLSDDISVCPMDENLRCQKPKTLKQVEKELTLIELHEPMQEPKLFSGIPAQADCFEVGADIEPNRVEIGKHFVECPDRPCGYLQTLVCNDKLVGLVAKMSKHNVNLFVPIDFIRKAAEKEMNRVS
ncbi:hypothetical protein Trydic_g5220 [Trypoxylus dichotomus]